MSGYLEGVLVLLAINVVYAYAAFLPIAAGQLNLGVAGFAAIGGYASAYLSTTLALSPLIAIPLGGVAAGAVRRARVTGVAGRWLCWAHGSHVGLPILAGSRRPDSRVSKPRCRRAL